MGVQSIVTAMRFSQPYNGWREKRSRTTVPGILEDAHTLCGHCTGEPLIIWQVDSRQGCDVDTQGLSVLRHVS